MAKDTILKARVDEELARRIDAWAEAHDMDRSEAIRTAVRLLLEKETWEKRLEAIEIEFDAYEAAGVFDPPEDDDWKAGGFR